MSHENRPDMHERATAFVFGELPRDEAIQFMKQLQQSPELQQTVHSIREAVGALESELDAATPSVKDADRQVIEAAMEQPAESSVTPPPVVYSPTGDDHAAHRVWVRLATAACVLVLLGLAVPTVRNAFYPQATLSGLEGKLREMEAKNRELDDRRRELELQVATQADQLRLAGVRGGRRMTIMSGDQVTRGSEEPDPSTNVDKEQADSELAGVRNQIDALEENGLVRLNRAEYERLVQEKRRLEELAGNAIQLHPDYLAAKELTDEYELGRPLTDAEKEAEKSRIQSLASQALGYTGGSSVVEQEGVSRLRALVDRQAVDPNAGDRTALATQGNSGQGETFPETERGSLQAGSNELAMGTSRSQPGLQTSGEAEMMMSLEDDMGMIGEIPQPVAGEMQMEMGGASGYGLEERVAEFDMMDAQTGMGGAGTQDMDMSDGSLEDMMMMGGSQLAMGGVPNRRGMESGWRFRGRGYLGQGHVGGRGFAEIELDERRGGDRFANIADNLFDSVSKAPLSTFSIDVDTAAYAKVRMYLMQHNRLPHPDAVRIEELLNYFPYDYEPPQDKRPFSAAMQVASCPWNPKHRLARVGIKGRVIEEHRPSSNLVFLLDVSGSMNQPNKLPLVVTGMKMLVNQLNENDSVAIVVYAGAAGLVLDSTTGDNKKVIVDSLERLRAGGSTNGGQGIQLAYQLARDHFIEGGTNRVILCSDGDFNVGVTGTEQLVKLAEENAQGDIFLSVLGFGTGNHNDDMMEKISNQGNGNYAFIDTESEARKVFVEQMAGTLVTIAKDVKIQVEFNPAEVQSYRLIGYENRMLAAKDFNDDAKDAGEIGAGHTVTALYEIVPAAKANEGKQRKPVDDLRYQRTLRLTELAESGELLTLKLRYKEPTGDVSTLMEFPVHDEGQTLNQADRDFQFAASVAAFGMLLRNSPHMGNANFAMVEELAVGGAEEDPSGYRDEFVSMVRRARLLASNN